MIQVVKTCEKITSEVASRACFGQISKNITIQREDGSTILASSEIFQLLNDSFRILFQTNKLLLLQHIILKRKRYMKTSQPAKKRITLKRSLFIQKNFLDLYFERNSFECKQKITIDNTIDNFSALFFVGTDPRRNIAGVSLYYLSQNPKFQEDDRDEVINILKS